MLRADRSKKTTYSVVSFYVVCGCGLELFLFYSRQCVLILEIYFCLRTQNENSACNLFNQKNIRGLIQFCVNLTSKAFTNKVPQKSLRDLMD